MQKKTLGDELFENLYQNGSIGVRCPENPAASMLLKYTKNPVLAPSANISGDSPPGEADTVQKNLDGKIDLILDGGLCKYGKNSTIVKIARNELNIVRQGVYTQKMLQNLSRIKILFLCTGNTCRSPMAEAICRKHIAEKLNCGLDETDKFGYIIDSAGIQNIGLQYPTVQAVRACTAKGIDITEHISKSINEELVNETDIIFAMAEKHRDYIIHLRPDAKEKCFLLAQQTDIADPLGRDQQFYNTCADIIEKAVKERISAIIK